jgi:hypothetical protein
MAPINDHVAVSGLLHLRNCSILEKGGSRVPTGVMKKRMSAAWNTVVMQGIVRPDGTLELEEKIPLPAGRVTVTLQRVPYSQETDPFFAMLRDIWDVRNQAGLVPRTREEIDAQIQGFAMNLMGV